MPETAVPLVPPSEEVEFLLDLIPEKIGFIFTGIPDRPNLRPQNLYDWSPDDPWVLTSEHTELTYPNDEYPEDQMLTVTNRKGEVLEYPYYEDADGKRYFLTAHIWYRQKDYVLGALERVAGEDPLGAARLLYRWAEVYEGYVPTNEYPWHNQPVEVSSTPPHYWWGGMWYRWSASDLINFLHLTNAFATVDATDAFEKLSSEVGEDVRRKIIQDMFLPSVDYVRSFPVLYHNVEYRNTRGLVSLGRALNDPSYIHEAVEWTEKYAQNTYLFDGFFQENTLSYHNQSTNGLIQVMDDLVGWSDPDGYESPRSGTRLENLDMTARVPVLDSALQIPRLLVYPDGKFFPTQDTWAYDEAGPPDHDAGSFLLPASGMARLARGRVPGMNDEYFGLTYDFPELDIVEQSVEHRNFPESGTLQLEANEPGHHIVFSFDVGEQDTYDVELKPFRAPSYGSYSVELDGQAIVDVDFYDTAGGPGEFEKLTTLPLGAGSHELAFRNTGKDPASTNYKMGVIRLALLDEQARAERDEAEREQGNPTRLYLTFNPNYGHHHFDPLNLALYAEGQELLPDIGYTHTFYRQLTRSTLAHNTVVVDSADMVDDEGGQHGGNIEIFAPITGEVQAIRASQQSAYPQTSEYSREAWLIQLPGAQNNEGYVLDVFRVTGGDRHEYTLHGDANRDATFDTSLELGQYGPYLLPEGVEVREPETETDKGSAEGHYYGYIYVRDVERATVPDGQYALTLVTESEGTAASRLRILGLAGAGQNELFVGESPSLRATRLHGRSMDTNDEAVKYMLPTMVLRREGTDLTSEFVTALEPFASGATPRVESIERLEPDEGAVGDVAVQVTCTDHVDIVLSSLEPDLPLVVGDITLQGRMGLIRMSGGQVHNMYLVGGTSLRTSDVEVTGDGPVTGTVASVRRRGAGDVLDALLTEATIPSALAGHTAVVTHPDGKAHGYRIKSVTTADGLTALEVDGTDPGFVVHADGTSELVFYPFTSWVGPTTFRIENIARLS